jgi:poly(3-hydroxybutyrate) depolymerase
MSIRNASSMCVLALLLAAAGSGCITQSQNTPVSSIGYIEPGTDTRYEVYVPSYYTARRSWPLVITLHGTFGFDSYGGQICEWKALAEEFGFIVAAPELHSTQGVLPRIGPLWYDDLDRDERSILAVLKDVKHLYRIASDSVLLTGFSAGGYPMIWTGLKHPDQFSMLVARSCTFDRGMIDLIPATQSARRLPVQIFYGAWDAVAGQSVAASTRLHERGFNASDRSTGGGHARRPDLAMAIWRDHLAIRDHKRGRPGLFHSASAAALTSAAIASVPDTPRPAPKPKRTAPPRRPAPVPARTIASTPPTPRRPARPASPPTAPYYVVREGDTLWAIAQGRLGSGTRWRQIAGLNPSIQPEHLSVGQRLRLPGSIR